MRRLLAAVGAATLTALALAVPAHADTPYDVLVFSKTAGFRHDSIPVGIQAIRDLGAANTFSVTATEDANAFTTANLAQYEVVVFLNTTGDVLNDAQQAAFESYVRSGRGYVGVHSAADTEYGWSFYGTLVGAYFASHPAIQPATVRVEDRTHPATAHLGTTWNRTDEWYNYQSNPRSSARVLAALDESSYSGGSMSGDHPISWCKAVQGGRSFYTGFGHTQESYADAAFRAHLLGGIRYAAGQAPADCSPSSGPQPGRVEAESFSSQSGTQNVADANAHGGVRVGYIDNGDWLGFSSVNVSGRTGFTARVASGGSGGTIQVRSGSQTGPVLGSLAVSNTGGYGSFVDVSTTLTSGSGPLFLVFTGTGGGGLFDVDDFALTGTGPQPQPPLSNNVHLFYYSWYGSAAVSGGWRHWQQGGHSPPNDIGADLYPTLGPYDSGDYAGAVAQHMAWVRQSGAGVIVYSWWGQGSYEDNLAMGVLNAANAQGVKVAWHMEPYGGRSAASTVNDINYINSRYGSHPAFFRDPARGNRGLYYVFESLNIADWTPLSQVAGSSIVLAQTTDTSRIAHFGGLYTYDAIAGATAPGWANAGAYARANNLVWSPSVGPGYLDDRAVPGNTTPTLARNNGATYDTEWTNALDPATGGLPTYVSITSFNEWHEGSTIEPARSSPPGGFGYQTYSGAYGRTGASAETAYLDRTAYWAAEFERRRGTPQPGVNLALNRPATADSSCNANEGPAKAVNGSVSGGNTDKWCSVGASKWWRVDLGATTGVGRIVVRHAGAGGENAAWNTRDFDLQVSSDGSAWTTVAAVRGNTANVSTHTTSGSGRYVRLVVVTATSDGNAAARVYEVEVYAQ